MHNLNDSLDYGNLLVFEQIFLERNATRAGRKLGLSQPAVSHALGRLRARFDDALFVRSRNGMVPTPRAERMAPLVSELLQRARALAAPIEFRAADLVRTFVVAGPDLFELLLLPQIMTLLEAEAPHVDVVSRPVDRDTGDALRDGRIDLVFGVLGTLPLEAHTQHLFDDDFVCVLRKGHPKAAKKMSLETFVSLSHVLISPRNEPGSAVDTALAKMGKSRRIAVRTHSFMAAPRVIATTDFVLSGPKRVLVPMAKDHGLVAMSPPVALRGFSAHQAWHPRQQDDEVHRWFRNVVRRAAAKGGAR